MNYGKKSTQKREKELTSKSTMIRKKFYVIFCKSLLVCVFAVMVIGACSGVGVIRGIIASAPTIDDIVATPTGFLSTVLDANGNQTATLVASGSNRRAVTIDEIPKNLQHAFVAIEDERFYEHNGIDVTGIIRAGVKGVASGFHFSEGASTITQQLLKNTVFTSWTSESSMADKFERKFQEQYLALQLEKVVDKDWILENYLNAINLGQNTLGVGVASERYFGKDVSDLTLSECAVLAAITQNPSKYNPITNPQENSKRRMKVLNNMKDQGYISQEEYDEAVADNVYDRIQLVNIESETNSINSYFVDELTDQVIQDLVEQKGYTETQAYKALYQGGLTIYSTQDPEIQAICDDEVNNLDNYPTAPKVSFSYRLSVRSADGSISNYSEQTMLSYYQSSNKSFSINFNSEEEAAAAIEQYKTDIMKDGDTIVNVIQDLVEQKGYTETQAYKALYQGGLTIYSTQDPEIQAICDDEVNNLDNYPTAPKVSFSYRLSVRSADGSISNYSEQTMLSYYQSSNKSFSINFNSEEEAAAAIEQYKTDIMKDGDTIVNGSETVTYTLQPQAALTIIDQSTGNVKALVGGRGDKTANKTLNRAADTTRQPGSTFKIIAAYAPALDAGGLTLASVQDDAPYNYGSGQGGAVNNYDNRYRGFTTLREAITNSINIVTVKTLAQIGPSLGYDYICDFGITTVGLDESSNETLALGGLTHGVTNLELTAAYATIANSGTYIKPKFYTKILDHDGNVLIDNTEPVSHTVLKDTTAWLLTDAMKDVMTQGTGTPAYFGSSMAQAGKSGTTTKNRDALFAGFTPYYTCVVWGGFDDNSPQSGGQTTYPKKIWKAVMSRIHENLEYQDFTKPSGIVTAQVCKESGKLAIAGVCDADPRGSQVYTEYFAEGTQPTEYCDHHIVANICNASGQLAGGYCPADSISSRVFVIGGTVGTEDTPYLLTDDFKNNTCTMHNEGNSTYQGTSAFSAVPGVNNDTSGGTQAPADNTQQTQPPANNSGGDNSDSTPADTGGTDNSGGGSSDNTPADTGGTDNSSGDNNSDGNGG